MKRLLRVCVLLLALALLPVSLFSCREKEEGAFAGVSAHGQLRVEDGRLKDSHGEPFQLRGVSTHGIAWFPQYVNAGSFAEVKAAGGNVIRVAMYVDTENGYLADPASNMTLMRQAIENAKALDMYVLVDWHILKEQDPNRCLDAAITFFDAVASAYPGDPAILYEICNEPNGVSWDAVQTYAYAMFPVIRQYSPQAVIVLGTPHFSGDLTEPVLHPFPGENFLYAFHFYAGLHDSYGTLEHALSQGLPVMVSEWGVDRKGEAPALEEGRAFAQYLNEQGISWCAWSLCNKDEVYSVLRPDCNALSDWSEESLTDVGRMIFDALKGGDA